MEWTFLYTDIWTEHFYIRIYGGKICTYKCAPNQEHVNQWFNGRNIVTHRYRAQSLEHMHVQQKVIFKNMVSRMEYLNIHIYGFTFRNIDLEATAIKFMNIIHCYVSFLNQNCVKLNILIDSHYIQMDY